MGKGKKGGKKGGKGSKKAEKAPAHGHGWYQVGFISTVLLVITFRIICISKGTIVSRKINLLKGTY